MEGQGRQCLQKVLNHTLGPPSLRVLGDAFGTVKHMVVSLNYCSQNGGNLYRAPYYNGNPI